MVPATLANPLLIQVIIDKVISQLEIFKNSLVGVNFGRILGSLRTFLFADTTNRIDMHSEVIICYGYHRVSDRRPVENSPRSRTRKYVTSTAKRLPPLLMLPLSDLHPGDGAL